MPTQRARDRCFHLQSGNVPGLREWGTGISVRVSCLPSGNNLLKAMAPGASRTPTFLQGGSYGVLSI